MSRVFPYTLGPDLGHKATLGLIVLQADETLEHDMRRLLPLEGVAQYVARIPSSLEVSESTLAQMEVDVPATAGRMPRGLRFDVVGFGCTSGASVIGPERVAEAVREGCEAAAVTDPLTALIAACRHLGVTRLGLLTPYVIEVSENMRGALGRAGIDTSVFGTFNEASEAAVARIDETSLTAAAMALAEADVEAVFMACTNLRTLGVIDRIEEAVGKPVMSSNQVLAWHMGQIAGIAWGTRAVGRLMRG